MLSILQQMGEMFEENPEMISIHPFSILREQLFMESLALIKYPEKFQRTLQQYDEKHLRGIS